MNPLNLSAPCLEEVEIAALGAHYAGLRIVKPRAEAAMEKSIRRHGQMQPVVCVKQADKIEVLDGFKRLRAMQRLGRATLLARIAQDMPPRVCKTLLLQLNQKSQSISPLEEGLVVASLYREDHLAQLEIAVMFGRDKSWVCRRIALAERLHEEVQTHIRLGLLGQVCGRELSRLPRGNQAAALACVLHNRLTSRQTGKLVGHLLTRQRWEYETILRSPWEIPGLGEDAPRIVPEDITTRLRAMRRSCRRVAEWAATPHGSSYPAELVADTLAAGEAAVSALRAWRGNHERA